MINFKNKIIFLMLIAIPDISFAQTVNSNANMSKIDAFSSRTDSIFEALVTTCDGNPTAAFLAKGFTAQLRPGAIYKKKIDSIPSTELEKLNKGILGKYKISYFVANPTYLRKYEKNTISEWVYAGNNGGMLGDAAGEFQSSIRNQLDAFSRAFGKGGLEASDFIMDRELASGLTIVDFEYNLLNNGNFKLVGFSGDKVKSIPIIERLVNSGVKIGKRSCARFSDIQSLILDVITLGLSRENFHKKAESKRREVCMDSNVQLLAINEKWTCHFSIKEGDRGLVDEVKLTPDEKVYIIYAVREIDKLNREILSDERRWGDFAGSALETKNSYISMHPDFLIDYESGKISDTDFINIFYKKDRVVLDLFAKTKDYIGSF